MSDVQSENWSDNPFTFGKQYTLPDVKPQPVPIKNILRDFFSKLKAKYIKMPPAKINPVEPVSTTAWSPEMGMGDTLTDRFAPNPAFIGIPLKRKDVPSQTGSKGWNTHYNVMVDQSGSMQAESTKYEGQSLDRSLVCRLATSCLVKQASFNTDSFTVYTYNDMGKPCFPIPAQPSYDYQGCIDFLTAESVSKVWNITDSQHSSVRHAYNYNDASENFLLNALAAMVPDGENNETHAMEVMIRGMKDNDIQGCITVFITDGDNLAGPLTEGKYSDETGGITYDEWMRQFGHVFYIVLRNQGNSAIESNKRKAREALMKIYSWDESLADKFVWGFPDDKMQDPATGEYLTDVADQMGWLFAEIGKIFAGTSDEFAELAEELGEIVNPDGSKGSYERPDTD